MRGRHLRRQLVHSVREEYENIVREIEGECTGRWVGACECHVFGPARHMHVVIVISQSEA